MRAAHEDKAVLEVTQWRGGAGVEHRPRERDVRANPCTRYEDANTRCWIRLVGGWRRLPGQAIQLHRLCIEGRRGSVGRTGEPCCAGGALG